VLTPELEAELDALTLAGSEKIERVALYIREQLATARAIKEEEDRIKARRQAAEKSADSLKRYLERNMERLHVERVDGLLCTVALQSNPPAVVSQLDEPALRNLVMTDPDLVTHVPESFTLNKRAVLDLHRAGGTLPVGVLVTVGSSLRIR
jgi:hypothetical protein